MMPPRSDRRSRVDALAFKAYEIEELADVWFFRPVGFVVARGAGALGLTPTHVTIAGGLVGVLAGALLYDETLGLVAFALLVVHSVLDSADGQLARMTGQVSELGRVLDGVGGYVTHAAIYVALVASAIQQGRGAAVMAWAAVAAVSNVVHAQLYDYHRQSYAAIVIRGEGGASASSPGAPSAVGAVVHFYERMQRLLTGNHERVMAAIRHRATGEAIRADDRQRYRASFYWLVRGWNVLGDNTRIYAVGALALAHHLHWFFAFVAVPMNMALTVLWLRQARADRLFLAAL